MGQRECDYLGDDSKINMNKTKSACVIIPLADPHNVNIRITPKRNFKKYNTNPFSTECNSFQTRF